MARLRPNAPSSSSPSSPRLRERRKKKRGGVEQRSHQLFRDLLTRAGPSYRTRHTRLVRHPALSEPLSRTNSFFSSLSRTTDSTLICSEAAGCKSKNNPEKRKKKRKRKNSIQAALGSLASRVICCGLVASSAASRLHPHSSDGRAPLFILSSPFRGGSALFIPDRVSVYLFFLLFFFPSPSPATLSFSLFSPLFPLV